MPFHWCCPSLRSQCNVKSLKKKPSIFSFHAIFLSAGASGAPMGTVRTPTHTDHTRNHLQTAMQTCINVTETQRCTAGKDAAEYGCQSERRLIFVNEFIHIKLFKWLSDNLLLQNLSFAKHSNLEATTMKSSIRTPKTAWSCAAPKEVFHLRRRAFFSIWDLDL